ncbi:nucleotidyl transferase domain protein [Leptospira interrogans serovar Bataviae str. HAI135]|nr:nucleotidyl transferase domain protein [Leptospira interrogans serovar Bataviae str. HAI135]
MYFQEKYGDPFQVVLSADAWIQPVKEFTKTISTALEHTKDHLVLLGIKPNRPEIGYGYIEAGKSTDGCFAVKSFYEKPDVKTALKYIKRKTSIGIQGFFYGELL